ncbi:MAG: double zinc ribbon domain-containing protein [Methylobacter sp.]
MNCSHCNEQNRAGAKYCKSCGKRLDHEPRCSTCGQNNRSCAKYCRKCGGELNQSIIKINANQKEVSNHKSPIGYSFKPILIGLSTLSLIGAGIYCYQYYEEYKIHEIEKIRKNEEKITAEKEKIAAEKKEKEDLEKFLSWKTVTEVDRLTDSKSVLISKNSISVSPLWQKTTPSLFLRCKDKFDVHFSFGEKLNQSGNNTSRFIFRFDNDPAMTADWPVTVDGTAAFAPDPVSFEKELKSHHTLLIKFNYYNNSAIAEFNIDKFPAQEISSCIKSISLKPALTQKAIQESSISDKSNSENLVNKNVTEKSNLNDVDRSYKSVSDNVQDNNALLFNYINKILEGAINDDGLAIDNNKHLIEQLPKPLKGNRKEARALNEQALELIRANQLETAATVLQKANQLDPSDSEIIDNYGYALLKSMRLNDAKFALENALLLNPGRATIWASYGEVLAMLNSRDLAVGAYLNTIRFSKDREKTFAFFNKKIEDNENPAVTSVLLKVLTKWNNSSNNETNLFEN